MKNKAQKVENTANLTVVKEESKITAIAKKFPNVMVCGMQENKEQNFLQKEIEILDRIKEIEEVEKIESGKNTGTNELIESIDKERLELLESERLQFIEKQNETDRKLNELFSMIENYKKENEELKLVKTIPVKTLTVLEMRELIIKKTGLSEKIDKFNSTLVVLNKAKDEIIQTEETLFESNLFKMQIVSTKGTVICSVSNHLIIRNLLSNLIEESFVAIAKLESDLLDL